MHKSPVLFKGKPYWPGLEGLVATPDGRFAIFLQTGRRSANRCLRAFVGHGAVSRKVGHCDNAETRNYPLAMTSDGRFPIGDGANPAW